MLKKMIFALLAIFILLCANACGGSDDGGEG